MTELPDSDTTQEQTNYSRDYPLLYPLTVSIMFLLASVILGGIIFQESIESYTENLFTVLIDALFTIFIINLFMRDLEKRRRKTELIYRLGSRVRGEAIRAAEELRRLPYWNDGSLRRGHFNGTDLQEAVLDSVDLKFAELHGALLQKSSICDAKLEGAALDRAQLQNASFRAASMCRVHLFGAQLTMADLTEVDLSEADLRKANLEKATLTQTSLKNADLSDAVLHEVNAWRIDMSSATLARATLTNAELRNSSIENADLTMAKMAGVKLLRVNLVGSVLKETDLSNSEINECDFSGATLFGANLTGATVAFVTCDEKTVLPDGTKWTRNSNLEHFTMSVCSKDGEN